MGPQSIKGSIRREARRFAYSPTPPRGIIPGKVPCEPPFLTEANLAKFTYLPQPRASGTTHQSPPRWVISYRDNPEENVGKSQERMCKIEAVGAGKQHRVIIIMEIQ